MRWQGRKESSNIEDRRGSGGGNFGGGRGTGVFGIIILLVGAYYGVDLSGLVGTPDFSGQSSQRYARRPYRLYPILRSPPLHTMEIPLPQP